MKMLTQRQTDRLFKGLACGVYDKFIENAVVAYSKLFPELCGSKSFDHAMYDKVRERLMIELQILYNEAKGEKNAKKKCKDVVKRAAIK
jgi:hypothetical protein